MEIIEGTRNGHCALGLLVALKNERLRSTYSELFQELEFRYETRDRSKVSGCGWLQGGRLRQGTYNTGTV